MASVLDTIKEMLGVSLEETAFDTSIIADINTTFLTLYQLGVGPSTVYSITSKDNQWVEFLGSSTDLEGVKSYIHLKVKMTFDPPDRQAVIEATNRSISELEFRLMIQAGGT